VPRVEVRGVEVGHDPAFMGEDDGHFLAEFEHDGPSWEIGDRFTLPNGAEVEVLGHRTLLDPSQDPTTVLFVGDV
jgi:hypothetical protein